MGHGGSLKSKAREYQTNLQRELHLHKCLLHHYNVIDFTLFEFGFRVIYLPYRLLITLLIPLLVLSLNEELSEVKHGATPRAALAYAHFWIYVLLSVHAAVDVAALAWSQLTTPTCELVLQRYVPWYFQVSWVLHNCAFPIVMSTMFMYKFFFHMDNILATDWYLFLAIAFYGVTHTGVTGVPTRIAHFLHPTVCMIAYIFFTVIYQVSGGTDPRANRYIYKQMDWADRLDATLMAILWIIATIICHILIAVGSWKRRKIFRRLRKGKEAVVNPDEDSLYSVDMDGLFEDQRQQSPKIWIEDIPNDPYGHKRVVVESPSPTRVPPSAVFHEVLHGPYVPGEKRRRIKVDTTNQGSGGMCFSPTGIAYDNEAPGCPRQRSVEQKFVCHPEMSKDGTTYLYKCMPEPGQGHNCPSCDRDRKLDLVALRSNDHWQARPDMELQPKAFTFNLEKDRHYANKQNAVNTKPVVCPVDHPRKSTPGDVPAPMPQDVSLAKSEPALEDSRRPTVVNNQPQHPKRMSMQPEDSRRESTQPQDRPSLLFGEQKKPKSSTSMTNRKSTLKL